MTSAPEDSVFQLRVGCNKQLGMFDEHTFLWTVLEKHRPLESCCSGVFGQLTDALETFGYATLEGEISANWRVLLPDNSSYECGSSRGGLRIVLDRDTEWNISGLHRARVVRDTQVELVRPTGFKLVPFHNDLLSRKATVLIDPEDGMFRVMGPAKTDLEELIELQRDDLAWV